MLLISIVVAAQLGSQVLDWGLLKHFSSSIQAIGLSPDLLFVLAYGVLSQGIAFSAWWLAMLIPHSKRSVWVPLALVLTLTLLYSALPLYRAISNFYKWAVFGDELWRILAWRFSQIGLQLVCIASPCYLLSRMGKLQLNRSGDVPQSTTFDIKRMLGLTVLVAIAFAAVRCTSSSESANYAGRVSPTLIVALSSISAVWLGIAWACLSWASASRSARWVAIALAALVLLSMGTAFLTYGILQSELGTAASSTGRFGPTGFGATRGGSTTRNSPMPAGASTFGGSGAKIDFCAVHPINGSSASSCRTSGENITILFASNTAGR